METFNERFLRLVSSKESHLCVGIDPDAVRVQSELALVVQREMEAMQKNADLSSFVENALSLLSSQGDDDGDDLEMPTRMKEAACRMLIRATAPYAAVFKPNVAFFEDELALLITAVDTIEEHAPEHIVICDAKRGDIGNTSAQYAEIFLERFEFDAITVNPLMGHDSVEPFLRNPERGAFLLCLTSNPGASDFLLQNDLYKRIAEKAMKWNVNGNVGLVVGATRAEHAAAVREIAPDLPLLIPGVGAQGGSLPEILDAVDAKNNRAFVINASRALMFPGTDDPEEYEGAVASEAEKLRDEIRRVISA